MSDLADKKCIPCEGNITSFKIDEIHKYLKKIDGWEVKEDQLEELALESFTNDRINNNIVELTHEQILKVLKSIWQGSLATC